MDEDNSWRTSSFRQSVVTKIEEAIRLSAVPVARNSMEMENHVFQKAKTKEEYLGFVARLILHVREMSSKKTGGMNGPQGQQAGPVMPDPINALQNLTQGSRNNPMMNMSQQGGPIGGAPQMAPMCGQNLIQQSLNRGGGQPMSNMPGNMQGRPQMNLGPNVCQMPNQMANQMSGQLGNQMPNQLQNQLANNMGNQMGNQMPGQINAQIQGNIQPNNLGPMGVQMANQMMGMQRKNDGMMMNAPNAGFPRNPTPNPYLRQSPTPSAPSPAALSGPPNSNQMVASPALASSPGAQMNMMQPQRSVGGMAPSPSSSLNTPGQPGQSPIGMQDEQAYRDKVRQLSKYIEPLRKMIARMGTDGEHVEKLSKMKKLLDILSSPNQRMPLETLLKCEVVLEKLDFKRSEGSVSAPLPIKEPHAFNPLLEAINNNLQSPVINHTLHRTFGPTLDVLFGPEIKLVPPLKRKKTEEPNCEIPDVLQGEIARLDQRFKVSLDPNQQPGSKTIQLICWLDDKHLPCVPPVSLSVPDDYPKTSPKCSMASHEYNATKFLSDVQNALLDRIKKMPKHFSVSQLLDTWEMSVRQASAPTQTPVTTTTLLMGL